MIVILFIDLQDSNFKYLQLTRNSAAYVVALLSKEIFLIPMQRRNKYESVPFSFKCVNTNPLLTTFLKKKIPIETIPAEKKTFVNLIFELIMTALSF